jgi:tRNA(Leu) C34 or U34 (ribose-2'-O)-methylase TrmL
LLTHCVVAGALPNIEPVATVQGPVNRGDGIAPAVALVDPKYPHNVGAAVRAASCYGIRQVWFSGDRVQLRGARGYRLPREERMRGYQDVELRQSDVFFDAFDRDVVPVAVEVRAGSESLIEFEHPDRALYVFGSEDGSLGRAVLRHCHRFVIIPTRHCTNLAAAVYTMLYDRHAKRVRGGLERPNRIAQSGAAIIEAESMMDEVGVTWGP